MKPVNMIASKHQELTLNTHIIFAKMGVELLHATKDIYTKDDTYKSHINISKLEQPSV